MNPKIRGWGNHYRHVVSKEVFSYVDDSIYRAVARWVKRRHPNQNAEWWRKHYFRSSGNRNWIFSTIDPKRPGQWIDLFRMGYIPISRHVKIIAKATPYDSVWSSYFDERLKKQRRQRAIQRSMLRLRSKGGRSSKAASGQVG
ncbi:MAG: ltrA 3 [Gammaproteobacteria bacterium]|nr:ltrA 3 [Gammaproteobacteria bacterium]